MAERRTDVAARLTAETSAFDRGLQRAGASITGLTQKVEASGKRIRAALRNTGVGNVAARMKGWATSIAAFAGVYGIGQAIHQIRAFEDSLEDLRRFGRMDQEWMTGARKAMLNISDSTGVAKEELAAFANKFVELTGNARVAMGALESMAKVSVATSTNMSTLAEMMELLSGTFNIKGAKAMSDVLGKLATQALLGTMSFKNIAATIGQVGGVAAAQLGAKGEEGATDIAGLMQLIVRVTRGPEETKTATLRFMESISRKHEKFRELTGLSLTTGQGADLKFKRLSEMTRLIGKGLAKATPEQLQELNKEVFQDARARRATAAILQAYRGGWSQQQGTWAAPTKLFGAKGTEGGVSIIDVMYGEGKKSPGHKLRESITNISNEIHRTLLPAFLDLAKVLPKLVPYLRWVIQHIDRLIGVWAIWKASGFFATFLKLGEAAKAVPAVSPGGMVATMNVTATTVNVMGGAGGVPGVVPGVGPKPGEPGFIGPVQPGAAPKPGSPKFIGPQIPEQSAFERRAWGSSTALFAKMFGISVGASLAMREAKRDVEKDPEYQRKMRQYMPKESIFGGAQSTLLWGRTEEHQEQTRGELYESLNRMADVALEGAGLKSSTQGADQANVIAQAVERAITTAMPKVQLTVDVNTPSQRVAQRSTTKGVG